MKASRFLAPVLGFVVLACALASGAVRAATEDSGSPMHWSGDKTLFDRKLNRVELVGNAAIHQEKESLYANRIVFEIDTKVVHASGNAVFVGRSAMIQADEMHFNLETRTGTILRGRVSTPNFTLTGEEIHKLGANRFQTHHGEYTTCRDCPQSWTFTAEDVDLEVEGYAQLSNVVAKIMDAPAFWLPYLIVPIKTKRQTGFLIPNLGFTNEGFTYVQPFFWAISPSVDMTFGLGNYGGRGRRIEWEGRYAWTDGKGQANLYQLADRTFDEYLNNKGFDAINESTRRWALRVEQQQKLPFNVDEKLRITEVSDNLYPSKVGDVGLTNEAFLASDLSFTHTNSKVATFVAARRFRNLMNLQTDDPRNFDRSTVQVLPQAEVTTNDKLFLDGAVAGGIRVGVTRFDRRAEFFDRDLLTPTTSSAPYRPGIDPLRKGTRFTVEPSVYTTMRLDDVITVVPSATYRQYFYDFSGNYDQGGTSLQPVPSLSRGYLLAQLEFSTQLERVYETSDPDVPRVKHLIRPQLTYSVIPYRHQPDHPFTEQMAYASDHGVSGYNFDNDDIVPLDASQAYSNYFAPLGNSLTYGFNSQLIRKKVSRVPVAPTPGKKGKPEETTELATYQTALNLDVGQAFNFRELRKEEGVRKPLSRLYSLLTATSDRMSAYLDYYYTPYLPFDEKTSRHTYSAGLKYSLEKSIHQNVLAFERSVQMAYVYNRTTAQSQTENYNARIVYSLSDYIMPSAYISYDLIQGKWQEADTALVFQSPSQCWRLDLGYNQSICEKILPSDSGWCGTFRFNLSLNLTGSGYGSMPGSTPPTP